MQEAQKIKKRRYPTKYQVATRIGVILTLVVFCILGFLIEVGL